MDLHMNYVKVYGFIAGILVLFTDANAIKVNDYSIMLTDDPKLDTMYKQDEYRAMASEILRQHYNAHLAKVRMKNKSELVQWDNETYNESVYGVILNEIARCFFNINNDMVTYNQFNGRMIECVGTNPLKYDSSNWNYVFLVNFIDRFMANTITPISGAAFNKLFNIALEDTKETMLNAKTTNGYMCDYATYKDAIERAYSDIKEYCTQLQLSDYLIELMRARLNTANIQYKWINKQDENGNAERKELDYEDAQSKYKEFITKIDKSPKDEKGRHIDEWNSNPWIFITTGLSGVNCYEQHNKVLYIKYADKLMEDDNTRIDQYHAREEKHIYIEQPNATALFKTYRIDFGRITEIGDKPITRRKTKNPKYIKLSDNKWYEILERSEWINMEHTYEGFHPKKKCQELLMPAYFNSNYKANKIIDDFDDKLIESWENERINKRLNILEQYDMNGTDFVDLYAKYIQTKPVPDFRTYIRAIYNIPWTIFWLYQWEVKEILFDGAPTYYKMLERAENKTHEEILSHQPITNTDPTDRNRITLMRLNQRLEEVKACKTLLKQIEATTPKNEQKISKYKQYEAIMIVRTVIQCIINKINNTTAADNNKMKEKRKYVAKLNKQLKRLKTATNMLPTDETIEKASQIIFEILQIKETDIEKNKYMQKFRKKLNGEYDFLDEIDEAFTLHPQKYFSRIEDYIEPQMRKYGWTGDEIRNCMIEAEYAAKEPPSLYKATNAQNPVSLSDIQNNG